MRSAGIHHVTALASDPQRTLDFYISTIGMRLVKRSVNFDAPTVHHFYFGDRRGRTGTLLTFFPFPDARPGRPGPGQASLVGLSVPPDSLEAWEERLRDRGVADVERVARADGSSAVALTDPDGLALQLVADPDAGPHPAADGGAPGAPDPGVSAPPGGVPAGRAVRGIHSVDLWERELEPTADVLEAIGFERGRLADDRIRFRAAGHGGTGGDTVDVAARPAPIVDVLLRPEGEEGSMSAGCVHHVAFRVADDAAQRAARRELLDRGLRVTPVLDRRYFRSIYFREPGGVLFEVATDGPGFGDDESLEELGSGLRLPPWLEERRPEIEAALPPVEAPRPG